MKGRHKDRQKSRYKSILAIFFIVFIGGFFLINMLKEYKDFSENENRMLAKKPKFTIDGLVEGRYTSKYERYKNDQFFLRNSFVEIKSSIDRLIGKKDSNGVFLGNSDNLIESFQKPDEVNLKENIDAINKLKEENKDIKTYFMLVPNSIAILEEDLPKNAPILNQNDYINNVSSMLSSDITFINPYDELVKHKEEELYYRTDHHWTTTGAYYGYLTACEKMNLEPNGLDYYDIETVSNNFYGTLSSRSLFEVDKPDEIKVYLPKSKEDEVVVNYIEEKEKSASLYNSSYLEGKDKYGMFLEGNHPLVKINTMAKGGKKLLLIKDSYANCFVQYLTPYYSEIVLVDPRYYYENIQELIKSEEVTDIMYLYNANTFFQDNSIAGAINS